MLSGRVRVRMIASRAPMGDPSVLTTRMPRTAIPMVLPLRVHW